MDRKLTTRKIVITGLMAALTVVGSAIRIVLPVDIGGNTAFHLGNIMCVLSGLLMGPWLGGLAAGLGSAIYDMTNPAYIADCWITFLTKGAMGMAAGLVVGKGKHLTYVRAAVASAAGSVTYMVLYLLKTFLKTMLVQGVAAEGALLAVVGKLPATVFNGVIAIIFAPILALAIHKALDQTGLLTR